MFAYAASHSLLLALFAGYAAHSGALGLGTLIVVCWFGSFAGDVIRFWIGRRYGARLLNRFPRFERPVQTAVRLTDRHYVWMILFHRFPHGIRGLAGFAYGISRLPWSTFLALNFVAAGLWSGAVVSARLRLRSILGEVHQQCLFGPRYRNVGRVPRPVLVAQQKARSDRGAVLDRRPSDKSPACGHEGARKYENCSPFSLPVHGRQGGNANLPHQITTQYFDFVRDFIFCGDFTLRLTMPRIKTSEHWRLAGGRDANPGHMMIGQ